MPNVAHNFHETIEKFKSFWLLCDLHVHTCTRARTENKTWPI